MKNRHAPAALLVALVACSSQPEQADDPGEEASGAPVDMSTAAPDASSPDLATHPPDQAPSLRDMADAGRVDLSSLDMSTTEEMGEPVDMATPPPTGTPILVAQGFMGRTLVSCDGGLSWTGDRDMAREGHANYCGVSQPEAECQRTACQHISNSGECVMYDQCKCDHDVGQPTGLTYGDGWFVMVTGHGAPNVVWRSRDGIDWEEVISQGGYHQVSHGEGAFVLGNNSFPSSSDGGLTWVQSERVGGLGNMSDMHYSPSRKLFFGVGRNGTARSDDLGKTWQRLEDWPAGCSGNFIGHIIQHQDIIIMTRSGSRDDGPNLCLSQNGGLTFVADMNFAPSPTLGATHDGSRFHFWSKTTHYTTLDGISWEEIPLQGLSDVKAIGYDPVHARYVASSKGAYESQRFYHSEDGTTWTELPTQNFPPGHAIRDFAFGYAQEGFTCPQ